MNADAQSRAVVESTKAAPGPRDWWSPRIDRKVVQAALRRRDLPGCLFFASWCAALSLTVWGLANTWGTLWSAPLLVTHGAVLSFAYAGSHECAHRTAFRTVWLNEAIFYLTSFIFGEEPTFRRYSHGRHHAYTWYWGFDSQMPYRNPMTLRAYVQQSLGLSSIAEGLVTMGRHACGNLTRDERSFVPHGKVSHLIWGSRAFLFGYVALTSFAVVTANWFLLMCTLGARFAGGWVVQLFINSQHMCMNESVPDHRYSTRSLRCWWSTRVLYWNMNYHVEHHLYPGVPFHALPALSGALHDQLPVPSLGALGANAAILRAIRRQTLEVAYAIGPRFPGEQSTQ